MSARVRVACPCGDGSCVSCDDNGLVTLSRRGLAVLAASDYVPVIGACEILANYRRLGLVTFADGGASCMVYRLTDAGRAALAGSRQQWVREVPTTQPNVAATEDDCG